MADDSYNVYGAITPSDTLNLTTPTDAIWVGGAGAVVAVMENGVAVTITAVPAGSLIPIRVKRINASGTVATAILALYAR